MPEPQAETREQVLRDAAAAGFQVSGDQLARWHRAGLLPHPRQRSLGRGLGTMTLYRPGTAAQLIALCRIRTRQRSLDQTAFQLWWDGFEVEPEQIRELARQAAARVDAELAGKPADGRRRSSSAEAVMSRRLGRRRWDQVSEAIRSAASQTTSEEVIAVGDLELLAMPPSLDELLALILPLLTRAVSGVSAAELVSEATYEELCASRDEAKLILASITRWVEPLAWLWGRKGTVLQLFANFSKTLAPRDLPDILLASLLLRRAIPPQIWAVVLTPPPPALREIATFKAIRDQVPGADTVITPMAVRAVMRGKEAAKRYQPAMSEFFREHEAEVRPLIPPDLLPQPESPAIEP
jgi:hypothetical protein